MALLRFNPTNAPILSLFRAASRPQTAFLWTTPNPTSSLAPLAGPLLGISSWIQDVWDSILKAVPKKKTSYSKKRSRQMAGKALKDVTEFVKCPSCGRPKRMNILCSYCLEATKRFIKGQWPLKRNQKVEAVEAGQSSATTKTKDEVKKDERLDLVN